MAAATNQALHRILQPLFGPRRLLEASHLFFGSWSGDVKRTNEKPLFANLTIKLRGNGDSSAAGRTSLFETYWLVYLAQRRWAGNDDWNFYGTCQPMVVVLRQVPSYSWLPTGHRMGSRRQLVTLGLGVSVES